MPVHPAARVGGMAQPRGLRRRVAARGEVARHRAGGRRRRRVRMARVPARRRAERLDGADHLGRIPGVVPLRRGLFPARTGRGGGERTAFPGVLRAHAVVRDRHAARGAREQSRRDVDCGRGDGAGVRAARGALQSQDLARSRVEIRHAGRARPGAGVVRHDLHLRGGDRQDRRRNAAELQLVGSAGHRAPTRPPAHPAGVHLHPGGLRHQGRPGADAHLAARCA